MLKRNLFMAGGVALLGAALIAVPGHTAPQNSADARIANLEQRLDELQARFASVRDRMQERFLSEQDRLSERAALAGERAQQVQEPLQQGQERLQRVAPMVESEDGGVLVIDDGNASWLGVESQDVNSEKAKGLKLPAERGVLLDSIVPDSPAAKAGLKENDVITEINGQRVEGEMQFRRMVHEIPAGRTAQFTIWRDGRAQSITVTLGKSEERANNWSKSMPRSFSFELPKVEVPDIQLGPGMDWNYGALAGARPRLGIDAEDLDGQLGAYFGAPDGEGILVREVNPGSPAEKAGVKSGDVITSVNGERVRSLGDLREQLANKHDAKSIKLGVVRNKSQMSLSVELPEPPAKSLRMFSHRTQI